jgi:hypothetical protein
MSKKIFISYCHKQEDWVLRRLKPCLDAGGAEVLIDRDRFKAGIRTVRQMDAEQDQSGRHRLSKMERVDRTYSNRLVEPTRRGGFGQRQYGFAAWIGHGSTASLRHSAACAPEPEDLIELDGAISARGMSHIAMLHLDNSISRRYGTDLFSALRFLIMESRKLALLAQSRQHFSQLVPQDHPLSAIDLKTVELNGRKR